jgi:hypothetical protein
MIKGNAYPKKDALNMSEAAVRDHRHAPHSSSGQEVSSTFSEEHIATTRGLQPSYFICGPGFDRLLDIQAVSLHYDRHTLKKPVRADIGIYCEVRRQLALWEANASPCAMVGLEILHTSSNILQV